MSTGGTYFIANSFQNTLFYVLNSIDGTIKNLFVYKSDAGIENLEQYVQTIYFLNDEDFLLSFKER